MQEMSKGSSKHAFCSSHRLCNYLIFHHCMNTYMSPEEPNTNIGILNSQAFGQPTVNIILAPNYCLWLSFSIPMELSPSTLQFNLYLKHCQGAGVVARQ